MKKEMILFSLKQAVNNKNIMNSDEIIEKIRDYIFDEKIQESDVRHLVDKLYPPTEDEEGNEILFEIMPLDVVREKQIERLKEKCSNTIFEGFTATNGHTYGFNYHDQMNFTQQRTEILNGNTSDVMWKTKDAGVINHTVDEFNQVMEDGKNHKLAQQQKYWNLEQQILNATTKEEVMSVEW
ncbi:MAG: DUF4376 domain-containing protein [Firmicutes bacterium]|nr:DUF4376 domain-containing protein [Bacillota bacterium]